MHWRIAQITVVICKVARSRYGIICVHHEETPCSYFVMYDGLCILRGYVDTELDHVIIVKFENVRFYRFGRQAFAIDESTV